MTVVDLLAAVLLQHRVVDVSVGQPGRVTGFRYECRCPWRGSLFDIRDFDQSSSARAEAMRHVAEQVCGAGGCGGVRS